MNDNKNWALHNSYLTLPKCFYERIEPIPVSDPTLIYFNENLAKKLNLEFLCYDKSLITNYFSGNKLPDNVNLYHKPMLDINLEILLCWVMEGLYY